MPEASEDTLMSLMIEMKASMKLMAEEQMKQRADMNKFQVLFDDMKQLREENAALKDLAVSLNKRLSDIENKQTKQDAGFVADTMREISEQRFRENNIILFDIPEDIIK